MKKTSCSTWERLAPLAGRLPKQWQHTKPAFFCTAFVSVIVGKFCNRRKKEIQGLKNMWWSAPLLGAGSALAVTLHWLPAWKPWARERNSLTPLWHKVSALSASRCLSTPSLPASFHLLVHWFACLVVRCQCSLSAHLFVTKLERLHVKCKGTILKIQYFFYRISTVGSRAFYPSVEKLSITPN